MALLGNYSVLNKNPGRHLGGPTVSFTGGETGKSGANRNRYVGWAGMVGWQSTPTGARPPVSWVIAIDDGGVASHSSTGVGSGTVSMSGARDILAAGSGTGSGTAVGGLIVQIVATGAGSSSGTVTLFGTMSIVAAGAGTSSGTITVTGLGNLVGAGEGTMSGTVTLPALGQIVAANGVSATLTADQVAASVWSSVAAQYVTAGTMGEALNVAQILLRNKTVTDPTAGTITVYDLDGTTVLYTADLFADAAGTTAYSGEGAERREHLA